MFTAQNTPPEFPVGLINPDPLLFPWSRQSVEEKVRVDYLNLPGLNTTEKPQESKYFIQVKAEQVGIATPPPDCECFVQEVKPHSTFLMPKVLDLPYARKSVVIDITRRRWMCRFCSKTGTQPLDFMAEGHYRMTRRLLEYTEVQSLLGTSELGLSEETGVFVRTIREIRKGFVERLKHEVKFATPRVLGMDGVGADGKRLRVIITDIEAGLVLDLLESRSKKNIMERLRKFPGRENIRYVAVDMCNTQIPAIREALPHAIIIIDLYHIIKTANEMMDKVRNRLFPRDKAKREPGQRFRPRPEPFRKGRDRLNKKDLAEMKYWFDKSPELELAYNLKEDFLKLFSEKTYSGRLLMFSDAARHFYKEWQNTLPVGDQYKPLRENLDIITKPMDKFGEYIFNYFDHQYTNAFTESMNRKIKDIIRDSRGCNFETLHARIVYGTYLRKQARSERARERQAILPHKKRKNRPQPNKQGQSTEVYEPPDHRQMSFNFTS